MAGMRISVLSLMGCLKVIRCLKITIYGPHAQPLLIAIFYSMYLRGPYIQLHVILLYVPNLRQKM
ncbi:hypothetical protein P691DRAFT_291588 [Macrolepiota fuliginosa MF-IS2]|uniref:Uncharacterized protein n=1 Tax=Macrolepiota fuliginosa MF-IS2 TaxID=1400762 RepID=A0A9P6BZ86_9AGAR|nr:hypothetical protein P691DRAFT_291588 [Macrolepiota fuliginosa MF-IS2]